MNDCAMKSAQHTRNVNVLNSLSFGRFSREESNERPLAVFLSQPMTKLLPRCDHHGTPRDANVICWAYLFSQVSRFQSSFEEHDIKYTEDHDMLQKVGFTEVEVHRLSELRRNLAAERKHLNLVEYRRLRFVRWLVQTGKLTEQITGIVK